MKYPAEVLVEGKKGREVVKASLRWVAREHSEIFQYFSDKVLRKTFAVTKYYRIILHWLVLASLRVFFDLFLEEIYFLLQTDESPFWKETSFNLVNRNETRYCFNHHLNWLWGWTQCVSLTWNCCSWRLKTNTLLKTLCCIKQQQQQPGSQKAPSNNPLWWQQPCFFSLIQQCSSAPCQLESWKL